MDFNKVKTFLVVAELGSVSKAAAQLHRTQPAISQAVRQLEEGLELVLLERRKGRIHLTPEGEALRRAGNQALGYLEDEMAKLKKGLETISGTVRVGAILDHGGRLLAERLASFRARYSEVSFQVSYGRNEQIERRLLDNEIDLAVIISLKQKAFFEVRPFVVEDEILVASPDYLKRVGTIRDYERVLDSSLVDMSESFECFRPWIAKNKRSLLSRLSSLSPTLVIESHQGMKDVAKSGLGLAMLPRQLVREELAAGSLVELMKSSKPIRVGVDLAWRKKRTDKRLLSLLIDHLLSRG